MFELDAILRHVSSKYFYCRHDKNFRPNFVSGDLILPKFGNLEFQQYLEYSVNIDIASYENGERFTHNPEGQAVPQVVWDYFQVICRHRGTWHNKLLCYSTW